MSQQRERVHPLIWRATAAICPNLIGAVVVAAFAAGWAAPAFAAEAPAAAEAQPATDNALATLCGIVETSAKGQGLPVNFFTRLIWRESAFRPGAVSPAGAQGVAQFMPGTASERGLADPFDPAAAIPELAKLLSELAQRFGNLGLAAAAYNAGPNALAGWLAGSGFLPVETQDYVLAITGHDVEEWRGDKPPALPRPTRARPVSRRSRSCAWPAARTHRPSFPGCLRPGACRSRQASTRAPRCALSPEHSTIIIA